jgi:hypothetical protein
MTGQRKSLKTTVNMFKILAKISTGDSRIQSRSANHKCTCAWGRLLPTTDTHDCSINKQVHKLSLNLSCIQTQQRSRLSLALTSARVSQHPVCSLRIFNKIQHMY